MVEQATGVDVSELAADFRGRLVGPDDDGYEELRHVWNGTVDRRPACIVQCSGVADVVAAVGFARERELPVAVRGGGHSIPGHSTCDDGIVIDLSPMQGVWVDPERKTARAQGGVTWGLFDREAGAHGLGVTGGQITHTGIAGLTLGGGIGWLMRKHGLTCDNLVSADVVTADGQLLRAGEDENPDLFWALRGGGGNFGVVTSFEYRLHPVGIIFGGLVAYPDERSVEILQLYRDVTASAPDELTLYAVFTTLPPLPFIPAELHGRSVLAIGACYAGPIEDGERVLQPIRDAGPLVDLLHPMPYTVLQGMLDPAAPPGDNYYVRGEYVADLSDETIEHLAEFGSARPGPITELHVGSMGGAISRVPEADTAFGHRDAGHTLIVIAHWQDPAQADEHVAWGRALTDAIRPASMGAYVNFLDDEGEERIRFAYGEEHFDRLAEVKGRYDPANLFRLNQNVAPSG
jgi:FAD/FMN-containing dehydrogenase